MFFFALSMRRKILIASDEGFRLYHLGNRADQAFRTLSAGSIRGKFAGDHFVHLLSELTDAINGYLLFLNTVYTRFKQEADSKPDNSKDAFDLRMYAGIMKEISQSGKVLDINVTTIIGNDLFNLIKKTETIIKICEHFGQVNLLAARTIIDEINTQIDIIGAVVNKCSNASKKFKKMKSVRSNV